eukprot:COSAG01_NODE_4134_length_5316_cov_6.930255_1_plen_248_part_00
MSISGCNSAAGEGRGPSAPVLGFGGRLDGRKGMGSAVGRPAGAGAAMASAEPEPSADDQLYVNDTEACAADVAQKQAAYRAGCQDPKLYRRVQLSGVAAAKMLIHAKRGCDEGVASTGTPTEIIGMLFGYADTKNAGTVVITDAFEIPLAGSCHDVAPFMPRQDGTMGEEFFYFFGKEGECEGLVEELRRTRPEGERAHEHSWPLLPPSHVHLRLLRPTHARAVGVGWGCAFAWQRCHLPPAGRRGQ